MSVQYLSTVLQHLIAPSHFPNLDPDVLYEMLTGTTTNPVLPHTTKTVIEFAPHDRKAHGAGSTV